MPTALITGASRGLGRALADALADRGWRLVIDARGADVLEAARAALAERTEVVAVAGGGGDEGQRAALVEGCAGAPDALINNASTPGPGPLPPLAELPPPA